MKSFFKEEIPFFRQIWFFIFGIGISITCDLKSLLLFKYVWLFSLIILILLLVITKVKKQFFLNWIAGLFVSILFILSGIIWAGVNKQIEWKNHFSKTESTNLIVIVRETPKIKGDIARFPVSVRYTINGQNTEQVSGNLLLALRFDTLSTLRIKYGDLLAIKAKYTETEAPYNPAEFNYKRFLSHLQIYHQSFINSNEIKILKSGCGNPVIDFALKYREHLVDKFKKYLPDKNAQSVASTLILGDRAELDQDILAAYQNTGTLHVLSVSGMHVMIVVIVLGFFFKRLEKFKAGKIIKLVCMLSLIWFYSLITGLAPSILRAALMVSFVLFSEFSKGKKNSYNILAIAAFIILIINPYSLMDVGFQLSFLAVLGLIYIHPKLYHLYIPRNKIIDFCWQCICVSLAAQIATTPLSIFYFHQFPVYFILGNLFMTIPATVIMIGGFIFLFIPTEAILNWAGLLLNHLITFTNAGLFHIENLPFSTVNQIWINKLELILFYFLLLFLLFNSIRKYQLLFYTTFILTISLSIKNIYAISQHKTIFFSLRKNTAVAYIKGKSCILITDLSPQDYTFKFSVKPYLDSCRVKYVKTIDPNLKDREVVYFIGDKKLKIINHKKNIFSPSQTDWLLLSGNKNYSLEKLSQHCVFKELFIGGKNSDFNTNKLKQQANLLNMDYHILKREQAKEFNH